MKNNDLKNEEKKLKLQKEENDRILLFTEIIISVSVTILFLLLIFFSIFTKQSNSLKIVAVFLGTVIFLIGIGTCILIEQKAGYYQCYYCKTKYIPTYKQVLLAPHIGRTRYLKCYKCQKRSWHKKVIN